MFNFAPASRVSSGFIRDAGNSKLHYCHTLAIVVTSTLIVCDWIQINISTLDLTRRIVAIVILGHVFQNPQKAAQQLHLLAVHLAQFSLAAFLLLRLLLPVRLQPRNYLVFFRCRNLSFLLRGGIIVWLRIELATRNFMTRSLPVPVSK